MQSLFEDYEENAVPLSRDTDAERILEKTKAKLPGVKRKRPVGLVLIAAAAVAVLCGAAAIVHYASVRDGAGSYIMPDTLRYDEDHPIIVEPESDTDDTAEDEFQYQPVDGDPKATVCYVRGDSGNKSFHDMTDAEKENFLVTSY